MTVLCQVGDGFVHLPIEDNEKLGLLTGYEASEARHYPIEVDFIWPSELLHATTHYIHVYSCDAFANCDMTFSHSSVP